MQKYAQVGDPLQRSATITSRTALHAGFEFEFEFEFELLLEFERGSAMNLNAPLTCQFSRSVAAAVRLGRSLMERLMHPCGTPYRHVCKARVARERERNAI